MKGKADSWNFLVEEDLLKMWENLTLTEDEDLEVGIKQVELKKRDNRG